MKYYILVLSKWYAFLRIFISCQIFFFVVNKKGLRGRDPCIVVNLFHERNSPEEDDDSDIFSTNSSELTRRMNDQDVDPTS